MSRAERVAEAARLLISVVRDVERAEGDRSTHAEFITIERTASSH